MILSNAPAEYDPAVFARWKAELETFAGQVHQTNRDIQIGIGCRAVFTDTTTGVRQAVTVAAGVVTVTAL